jgi:hypothetical protein
MSKKEDATTTTSNEMKLSKNRPIHPSHELVPEIGLALLHVSTASWDIFFLGVARSLVAQMMLPGRSSCGGSAARLLMIRAMRNSCARLRPLQWTTAAQSADGRFLLGRCAGGGGGGVASSIRSATTTTSTTRTATTLAGDSEDHRKQNRDDSKDWWSVDPSVADALRNGRPVVALESTIVAHGMPWPQNFHLAQEVETILRKQGVEPATIGTKYHFVLFSGFC